MSIMQGFAEVVSKTVIPTRWESCEDLAKNEPPSFLTKCQLVSLLLSLLLTSS